MAIQTYSTRTHALTPSSSSSSRFNDALPRALPRALLGHSFIFLSPIEFVRMDQVCKSWLKTTRSLYPLQKQLTVCCEQIRRREAINSTINFLTSRGSPKPIQFKNFFQDERVNFLLDRFERILGRQFAPKATNPVCSVAGKMMLSDGCDPVNRFRFCNAGRKYAVELQGGIQHALSLELLKAIEAKFNAQLKKISFKMDCVKVLPGVLSVEIFEYLTPIEFIAARGVSKCWFHASMSILPLQRHFDRCSAKVNRLASVSLALSFFSNRFVCTNPNAMIKSFQENVELKPLQRRLQYLIGKNLLKRGFTEAEYIEAGKRFVELRSWDLLSCAILGMTIDRYVPELQRERSRTSMSDLTFIAEKLSADLKNAIANRNAQTVISTSTSRTKE